MDIWTFVPVPVNPASTADIYIHKCINTYIHLYQYIQTYVYINVFIYVYVYVPVPVNPANTANSSRS
jgi:hypothetical protein